MEAIVTRADLAGLAAGLAAQGKSIVTTNGCFDILHVGHVRILEQARALGDILIVGINSDASVKRLKGPSRPINSQDDRAEVLAALACVDFVSIFDEDTPVEFLTEVRPKIHVKGSDYKPEDLAETVVVEGGGGRVHILSLVPGKSTSGVVEKIRQSGL